MDPPQKPVDQQQNQVTVSVVQLGKPVSQNPYWQSSILGCFANCGVMCQTCCCFECTVSNIHTKLETGVPSCSCCECCILHCCDPCMLLMGVRREVVERYSLQDESVCKTLCCTQCCCCCGWCQVQNELLTRGDGAGGCCATGHMSQAPQADGMGQVQNAAVKMNYGGHQPGNWGSGLCGCAGCGDCMENWCCPCCVMGYVAGKTDRLHTPGEEGNQGLSCCAMLCSLGMPCQYAYMLRRGLIERYNIQGETHLRSVCCACCCTPCANGQTRREMGYRGEWPGGLCVKDAPTQKV